MATVPTFDIPGGLGQPQMEVYMAHKFMPQLCYLGFAIILLSTVSCDGSRQTRPMGASEQSPLKASELTRPKAAELIRNSPVFNEPRFKELIWGVIPRWPQDNRSIPLYAVLESHGLVKMEPAGFMQTRVTLTEKGRAESKNWRRYPDRAWKGSEVADVPVAKRELMEVTGISPQRPGRAAVEFTWRWVSTSATFEVMAEDARTHSGAVICQLYDDGWRSSRVQAEWELR